MVDKESPICLSSNWNTLGDVSLDNVLIEDLYDDWEIDIQGMSADNCVCLVNNCSEKPKAELEIKTKGHITDISLLSEAHVIEVFGVNDEYLYTSTAEFFGEWEEMAVYYSKITLPNVPTCKLKFTRAKCEDRVWIYGAKIHIQKTNLERRTFNFEQISRLIGNSNLNEINRENNKKNLLQFCLETLPQNNLGIMFGKKLDNCEFHREAPGIVSNENNSESGLSEVTSRMNINLPQSSENDLKCSNNISNEAFASNFFISYIDKKFHEIKNDVLREVDVRLNNLREETNYKLDKIISLLESERTNVQIK